MHGREAADYYAHPRWGSQELWIRFHVIDVTQLSDEELLTYGLCAPMEVLLKHGRDGNFELAPSAYSDVFHACIAEVGAMKFISEMTGLSIEKVKQLKPWREETSPTIDTSGIWWKILM